MQGGAVGERRRCASRGRSTTKRHMAAITRQSGASNVRLTVSVHIPVIVFLGFVTRRGRHSACKPASWVSRVFDSHRQIKWPQEAYDAARWGRKLSSVVDVTLVDIRHAFVPCAPCCLSTCASCAVWQAHLLGAALSCQTVQVAGREIVRGIQERALFEASTRNAGAGLVLICGVSPLSAPRPL